MVRQCTLRGQVLDRFVDLAADTKRSPMHSTKPSTKRASALRQRRRACSNPGVCSTGGTTFDAWDFAVSAQPHETWARRRPQPRTSQNTNISNGRSVTQPTDATRNGLRFPQWFLMDTGRGWGDSARNLVTSFVSPFLCGTPLSCLVLTLSPRPRPVVRHWAHVHVDAFLIVYVVDVGV